MNKPAPPNDLAPSDETGASVRLAIGGMSCATCSKRIEKVLRKQAGVVSVQVNLATEIATIAHGLGEIETSALIATVERAGFEASIAPSTSAARRKHAENEARELRYEAGIVALSTLLTLPLVLPMLLSQLGLHWMLPGWLQLVLAAPIQLFVAARFYRGAWGALTSRTGNMDLLVAMGTTAAFGLSLAMLATGGHLYFEASAAVITLVRLGKLLEARAKHSTTRAIRALMALRPETARVLRDDREIEVPAEAVGAGDVVVVKPGERTPVDGIIVKGHSQLDESLLTGESMPVDRSQGDEVAGGSINGAGLLHVEATNVGADSLLSRIVALIEGAQATKAPIQNSVDRVAAVFVPAVSIIAALTFLGWLIVGAHLSVAIIAAVSVLVVACPCALGLATPTALMVGTGAAARAGILIKDAEALERACAVDTVVFDKTGTLTVGHPQVQAIIPAQKADEQSLLSLTAAAQRGSEHPLARAVLERATNSELELGSLESIEVIPGMGLEATVDQHHLLIGNRDLMTRHGVSFDELEGRAVELENRGMTVIWSASSSELMGIIGIGDAVREGVKETIERLRAEGVEVVMLTGDNRRTAEFVGRRIGVDRIVAEVLPEDKLSEVAGLREKGRVVAMVGDGINDAPALAAADVGFAMGSGTDVAMHTAGITLMRPVPSLVADAIGVSRATSRKIHQNLFWAFIYNIVGLPLAALGLLSPVFAGAAMAASSVSVVSNSLLLRRWKPRGVKL